MSTIPETFARMTQAEREGDDAEVEYQRDVLFILERELRVAAFNRHEAAVIEALVHRGLTHDEAHDAVHRPAFTTCLHRGISAETTAFLIVKMRQTAK